MSGADLYIKQLYSRQLNSGKKPADTLPSGNPKISYLNKQGKLQQSFAKSDDAKSGNPHSHKQGPTIIHKDASTNYIRRLDSRPLGPSIMDPRYKPSNESLENFRRAQQPSKKAKNTAAMRGFEKVKDVFHHRVNAPLNRAYHGAKNAIKNVGHKIASKAVNYAVKKTFGKGKKRHLKRLYK